MPWNREMPTHAIAVVYPIAPGHFSHEEVIVYAEGYTKETATNVLTLDYSHPFPGGRSVAENHAREVLENPQVLTDVQAWLSEIEMQGEELDSGTKKVLCDHGHYMELKKMNKFPIFEKTIEGVKVLYYCVLCKSARPALIRISLPQDE